MYIGHHMYQTRVQVNSLSVKSNKRLAGDLMYIGHHTCQTHVHMNIPSKQ